MTKTYTDLDNDLSCSFAAFFLLKFSSPGASLLNYLWLLIRCILVLVGTCFKKFFDRIADNTAAHQISRDLFVGRLDSTVQYHLYIPPHTDAFICCISAFWRL